MSQLKARFNEQLQMVKEEAEIKFKQMIEENGGLLYEELEVVIKVKNNVRKRRQNSTAESIAIQSEKLKIEDPRIHFQQNAENAATHLKVLEEANHGDEITLQCKGEITRVISNCILDICPEAVPSVMKPFVATYLNALSAHLNLEYFFDNSNCCKKGTVFRSIRCAKRPKKTIVSVKKSKSEDAGADEGKGDGNIVVAEEELIVSSDGLEQHDENEENFENAAPENASNELFKSLFSIKTFANGTSASQNSVESLINAEELEMPINPEIIIEQNLDTDIFDKLKSLRRSSLVPSDVLSGVSGVIAKNIIEQKKVVSKEAVVEFTGEFLNVCNYGVDKLNFTRNNAKPVMDQIRIILESENELSSSITLPDSAQKDNSVEALPSHEQTPVKQSHGFAKFLTTNV